MLPNETDPITDDITITLKGPVAHPVAGAAAVIIKLLQTLRMDYSQWIPVLDAAKAVAQSYPETDPLSRVVHNWAYLYDRGRREPYNSLGCLTLHHALGLHDGLPIRGLQEDATPPGTVRQTAEAAQRTSPSGPLSSQPASTRRGPE